MKAKRPTAAELEILKTCSYITDDITVATYHGVAIKRVKQVRKLMHKEVAARMRSPEAGTTTVGAPIWNNDAERKARANAKEGSAKLLSALLEHFENRRRGIAA